MPSLRCIYLLVPLTWVFFCSPTLLAQHKVMVIAESPVSEKVASTLKAQIGSTSRYSLTDSNEGEIIVVDLECIDVIVAGHSVGVACSSGIEVWPAHLGALPVQLNNDVFVSGGSTEVAQPIFEAFVAETSDEKIRKAIKAFVDRVKAHQAYFCSSAETKQ